MKERFLLNRGKKFLSNGQDEPDTPEQNKTAQRDYGSTWDLSVLVTSKLLSLEFWGYVEVREGGVEEGK